MRNCVFGILQNQISNFFVGFELQWALSCLQNEAFNHPSRQLNVFFCVLKLRNLLIVIGLFFNVVDSSHEREFDALNISNKVNSKKVLCNCCISKSFNKTKVLGQDLWVESIKMSVVSHILCC